MSNLLDAHRHRLLIVPSEIQAREFDAKLLLACVAAEQGFASVVGSRVEIHIRIGSIPPAVYVAKDMRRASCRMFGILQGLGHRIVGWDEETPLIDPGVIIGQGRIADCAIARTEMFMCWGRHDAALWAAAPGYAGQPIVITGNPRVDLLRPELARFHAESAASLQERFPRMILVNTNFGRLNFFVEEMKLPESSSQTVRDFWAFRGKLFEAFKLMLPRLADAFPDRTVVLRPHPAERADTWTAAAMDRPNIRVLHEGPVIPWLLAADVLVHNSCTTGLEAFVIGTPTVAFRPLRSAEHDIPTVNELGAEADSVDALVTRIRGILDGTQPVPVTEHQRMLARHQFENMDGPLAADRIAGQLASFVETAVLPRPAALTNRLHSRYDATIRAAKKRVKSFFPGNKNSRVYSLQRFPGISSEEVNTLIGRLRAALGRFEAVRAVGLRRDVFLVYRSD